MADQAAGAGATQAGAAAAAGAGAAAGAAAAGAQQTTQAAASATNATAADKATGTTTTADGKASTQGDGKAATTADTAAAELEIKLPDGVTADVELMDGFKTLAKEHKLTSEQAQKLVDFNLAAAKKQAERTARAWEQQKKSWEAELKADPEFGGQHFDANMDVANKAARQFGGEALVKVLEDTGLGRHPVLVKMLSAVGKAIADDKVDRGASANHTEAPTLEQHIANIFPKSGAAMIKEHQARKGA
jgi:hypothetical protein